MKKQEIEVSGPDVEDAIISGLERLGVSRDQVEVEIVEEGRRGLLGIGGREAVVRLRVVTAPEPDPAPAKTQPDPKPPQSDVLQPDSSAAPRPAKSRPKEKVTPEVANSNEYFRDALNDLLAEGSKVF